MPIKTRRWNDPVKKDDGIRILICRHRPRAVAKDAEPWDLWCADLSPSPTLQASYSGHTEEGLTWEQFRERYLDEMKGQAENIQFLARKVSEGATITLLCAAGCKRHDRCHRSLLRGIIEGDVTALLARGPVAAEPGVVG